MRDGVVTAEKEYLFRDARKVIDTLTRFGNVIVPSFEGIVNPTAKERLAWIVRTAQEKYGMSIDDLQKGIDGL